MVKKCTDTQARKGRQGQKTEGRGGKGKGGNEQKEKERQEGMNGEAMSDYKDKRCMMGKRQRYRNVSSKACKKRMKGCSKERKGKRARKKEIDMV